MSLPSIASDEWKAEISFYLSATMEQREKRAEELGMMKISYEKRMRERGVHTSKEVEVPPLPEVEIPSIPDLKIKPFKVGKIQRDEEDVGIVLADHHIGRETASYNPTIHKARMNFLLDSAMTIINLHRPIRNVIVLMLGDMVHGESVYKGGHIEECKIGAYGQIYEHAIPTLAAFLVSLSQGVSKVDWYGVRGNHGSYDKTAVPRTNWDNFLYQGLNTHLQNQKNIIGHISTEFYQLVNIRGFRFFLIHGDQVRSSQGIPLFALRRKYQEYYAYVGGFHYAYNGHWHVGGKDHINSVAQYTMCPPLVTGDDWALEVVGRASSPIQLIFGVHSKYGRTFEYDLHCDPAFVPKPFNEGN